MRFLGTKATTKKKRLIFVEFVWLEILALFTFSTNLFSELTDLLELTKAPGGRNRMAPRSPFDQFENHPGFFREEKVEDIDDSSEFCGEKSFTHLGRVFRNGSSLKDLGHSRYHQGLAPPKFPVYIFGIFGGEIGE